MKFASHALATLALLALPSSALAVPLTLTFDTGHYDETIIDPGGEIHGPFDWLESGARIAGFWATDIGGPAGAYQQGHTHLRPPRANGRDTGFKEVTHSWTGDLQGLEISLENGLTFDLISVDYRVANLERTDDPKQLRLPWTWAVEDPQILAAIDFDPNVVDFSSEWTPYAANPDRDWHTVYFNGDFDSITSVMLSQSAHNVWLDNIVIDVHPVVPIPEPGTSILVGLGMIGLASRQIGRYFSPVNA